VPPRSRYARGVGARAPRWHVCPAGAAQGRAGCGERGFRGFGGAARWAAPCAAAPECGAACERQWAWPRSAPPGPAGRPAAAAGGGGGWGGGRTWLGRRWGMRDQEGWCATLLRQPRGGAADPWQRGKPRRRAARAKPPPGWCRRGGAAGSPRRLGRRVRRGSQPGVRLAQTGRRARLSRTRTVGQGPDAAAGARARFTPKEKRHRLKPAAPGR
jgi:hypothetical protein